MSTLRDILDDNIRERGETTPAMELADEYREQLDHLTTLLHMEGSSTDEIFKLAKILDNLQQEFRLEYLLTSGPLERTPMADLVRETVSVLKASATEFPHKKKILANSSSREPIIRSGKEPSNAE